MKHFLVTASIMLAAFPAAAQELSDERIKELALQAILENPQIIMEAVALLDAQRDAEQAAAREEVIARQRDLLENDPNAPFVGPEDASAVVVEFFDYNCPYCKRNAPDLTALVENDADVRIVYREWPILGEGSVFASRAALAAREQGLYPEMHNALMALRGRSDEASVLAAARDVGLDIDKLLSDMQSEAVSNHIETSNSLAQALGFTGTPSFVVGDAFAPGAIPLAELERLVAQARASE